MPGKKLNLVFILCLALIIIIFLCSYLFVVVTKFNVSGTGQSAVQPQIFSKYKHPVLNFYLDYPNGYLLKDQSFRQEAFLSIKSLSASDMDPVLILESFVYDGSLTDKSLNDSILLATRAGCDASGPQGNSYCITTMEQENAVRKYQNQYGMTGIEYYLTYIHEERTLTDTIKTSLDFGPFIAIYTNDKISGVSALILGPTYPLEKNKEEFVETLYFVANSLHL